MLFEIRTHPGCETVVCVCCGDPIPSDAPAIPALKIGLPHRATGICLECCYRITNAVYTHQHTATVPRKAHGA